MIDEATIPALPEPDLHGLFIDDGGGDIEVQREVTPAVLKRASKAKCIAMLKREHLRDVLTEAPEPGHTYHLISNGRFDFWTFVPAMVDWIGRADEMYVSTWTLNRGNAVDLFALMDAGKIGNVGFLTGLYFKRRESSVYAMLLEGLRNRGGRYVSLANHAKVTLLHNAERDAWIVVEGSANLTANPRVEQYVLTNDPKVYQFHRAWMESCLQAGRDELPVEPKAKPKRKGYSQRRAGLGVLAVTSDCDDRITVLKWKAADTEDSDTTRRLAGELADLIREAMPTLPTGCIVTTPPQGASAPGHYFAEALGRAVAKRLGIEYVETVARTDTKTQHHPMASLRQTPYRVTSTPSAAIVVDDLITSGTTMRLALEALHGAGAAAWGFAYSGS